MIYVNQLGQSVLCGISRAVALAVRDGAFGGVVRLSPMDWELLQNDLSFRPTSKWSIDYDADDRTTHYIEIHVCGRYTKVYVAPELSDGEVDVRLTSEVPHSRLEAE